MRLAAFPRSPQAQLDGFRSRVLRAEASAQSPLYVTGWHVLDAPKQCAASVFMVSDAKVLVGYKTALSALPASAKIESIGCMASVVIASTSASTLPVLEVALALVQTQATVGLAPTVWLLTDDAYLAACRPAHVGLWGLARSTRVEALVPLQCIDVAVATALGRGGLVRIEAEAALSLLVALVPRLSTVPAAKGFIKKTIDGSHHLTGGTGGLGLLTARWLVQNGARSLSLGSRVGALTLHTRKEWNLIQQAGAALSHTVRPARCSIAPQRRKSMY